MGKATIDVLAPRIGDKVLFWTEDTDHPRIVEGIGEVAARWRANPALVVGTHVKGPPLERGPRASEDAHDCMLFVAFGPYTGSGGGCGNRYVRAADWGHVREGGVTWPDFEPLTIGGVEVE